MPPSLTETGIRNSDPPSNTHDVRQAANPHNVQHNLHHRPMEPAKHASLTGDFRPSKTPRHPTPATPKRAPHNNDGGSELRLLSSLKGRCHASLRAPIKASDPRHAANPHSVHSLLEVEVATGYGTTMPASVTSNSRPSITLGFPTLQHPFMCHTVLKGALSQACQHA